MCVGWTKHASANPLAYWVRSLVPEALAQQVSGVNWRWGIARFRAWLLQPSGQDVNRMCVGWTKHASANPLAY